MVLISRAKRLAIQARFSGNFLKFLGLIVVLVLCGFLTALNINNGRTGTTHFNEKEILSRKRQDVRDRVCRIPTLDINATEVAGFFHKTAPIKCKGPAPWAFIDGNGHFQLIDKRKNAACTVREIIRVNDANTNFGNEMKQEIGKGLPVDFVSVKCTDGGRKWNGLLMSVVPQTESIIRAKVKSNNKKSDWSGLDVYIMAFDSLSQMTFRRKLPKTVEYLEKVMGGIVLNGYNIVGDGTPQAIIPILTSQTELELPLTRKRYKEANYVDDAYPMIWNNFSDMGYVTGFGEDMALYSTFTYRLKGFRKQPTDHFPKTFFQESEKKDRGSTCVSGEPFHKQWYRYSNEFYKVYKDVSKFLFMFLGVYSHDDINLVGAIDDDVVNHLKEMFEGGHLDNSLLVIMADHGHRFAKLRSTHQGQIEERLPMMSFALPKKFREGKGKIAWQNFMENKNTLSTPFDIHATLMDVLHWPDDQQLNELQDPSKRSLSLFRPIPFSRTCDQAGVEAHWCTCLARDDVLKQNRTLIQKMASQIVDRINEETLPERKLCAPLKLKEIKEAYLLSSNANLLKYKNVKDLDGFKPDLGGKTKSSFVFYQITLVTTPGDAVYEVTLRYDLITKQFTIDLKTISHVNMYGDRPHCIIDKNYFLATYCVCYDKI